MKGEKHMQFDHNGMLQGIRHIASPNCDARPDGMAISLLVIHNISLPPNEYGGNGVIELFTNRLDPTAHPYYETIKDLKVSSHFFIRRDGEIIQFVPCGKRAWHAGASTWQGRERCNDFSIGIELEGSDFEAFTDTQYDRLITLAQALQATYPISDIAGHSDIAPGRKTDPGPLFDWARLRKALDAKPRSDKNQSEPTRQAVMDSEKSPIKIAIADDDPITRQILRSLLRENKFEVTGEASDGSGALGLCAKDPAPDIICLDINMPKMGGIDALREIRKQHPNIIVIMISMSATPDNVKESIGNGAHGFIVKPFNPGRVLDTLNGCLKKAGKL